MLTTVCYVRHHLVCLGGVGRDITSPHVSLNREGRWGTTDDFATSFLHFSLFSNALRDLANSRPVHSLMLSPHLFFCLPCLLPPLIVPCKVVLARPDERGDMSIPLQLASLYDDQEVFVWSDCCWTSSLVTWSAYKMRSILR